MTRLPPGIVAANREALARLAAADPILMPAGTVGAPFGCFTAALEALARTPHVA